MIPGSPMIRALRAEAAAAEVRPGRRLRISIQKVEPTPSSLSTPDAAAVGLGDMAHDGEAQAGTCTAQVTEPLPRGRARARARSTL